MSKNATLPVGLLSLLLLACGPADRVTETVEADGCPTGLSMCGDECVDLEADPENCGSCSYDCRMPESNTCFQGSCACLGRNHQIADACDAPTLCAEGIGRCLFPDYGTTDTCDEVEGLGCDDPNEVCLVGLCTLPDCDQPEECNGRDDDCDGHVDADGPVPGPPDPLRRACYDGDPSEIDVGICRAGEQLCYYGTWTPDGQCPGEVLPSPESGLLGCDGVDNDCNDCVDDSYDMDGELVCDMPDPVETDVVFMIDTSGSMSGTIAAVTTAIGTFGSLYATASWISWAIEKISEGGIGFVEVYHPLTDYPAFLTALAAMTSGSGGTEPTYDAVWRTATGEFDASLSTRAGALPLYVVFTDETAQTETGLTESDVCAAVDARGALLVVFTRSEWYGQWDACATIFPLSSDAADMTSKLDMLFEMTCGN